MSDYEFWSSRYALQAAWTRETRNYILQNIFFPPQANILEVGCGSLAVLNEFTELGHMTFGLDIDFQILNFSKNSKTKTKLINANGKQIPFPEGTFDLCFCHYLLLWLADPVSLLEEMTRVTNPNGWICCFAEPDYLARIDFPAPLEQLGQIQNKSLDNQGVNLSCGRKITFWLQQANLSNIHWGIIGSHQKTDLKNIGKSEWETLQKDLEKISTLESSLNFQEIEDYYLSQTLGINFIPTFYAYAQKTD